MPFSESSGGRHMFARRAARRTSATSEAVPPTDRAAPNSTRLRSSVFRSAADARATAAANRSLATKCASTPVTSTTRHVSAGAEPRLRVHAAVRRREQDEIAAIGLPRLDVRKDRLQRGVDRLQRARVDLVRLHPLREHALIAEARPGRLVVLPREEAGDAGAKRI